MKDDVSEILRLIRPDIWTKKVLELNVVTYVSEALGPVSNIIVYTFFLPNALEDWI